MKKTPQQVIFELVQYYSDLASDRSTGLTQMLRLFSEAFLGCVKEVKTTTGKESFMARWVSPVLYVPDYDSNCVAVEPETSYLLHELVHICNTYKKRHQGILGLRMDETQAELVTYMVDVCFSIADLEKGMRSGISLDKVRQKWSGIATRIYDMLGMKIQGVCRRFVTQADLDTLHKEFGFRLLKDDIKTSLEDAYIAYRGF